MAELAFLLVFVFGGTVGFFIGHSTAPERPQGSAPGGGVRSGQGPDNYPLP